MGQIKELCKGYDQRDTWNMNESGCFFKSVAYKRFSSKKKLKAEDHDAFFVSTDGGKVVKPIMI